MGTTNGSEAPEPRYPSLGFLAVLGIVDALIIGGALLLTWFNRGVPFGQAYGFLGWSWSILLLLFIVGGASAWVVVVETREVRSSGDVD